MIPAAGIYEADDGGRMIPVRSVDGDGPNYFCSWGYDEAVGILFQAVDRSLFMFCTAEKCP